MNKWNIPLAIICLVLVGANVSSVMKISEFSRLAQRSLDVASEWEKVAKQERSTAALWQDTSEKQRDNFLVCNSMLSPAQRMAQ